MTRHRRAIGPVGSAARAAGGLAAIVLSIVVSGVTWWDVGVALVALPVTAIIAAAAVTASYRRYSTGRAHPLVAESWIRSVLVLALVVGVEIALSFRYAARRCRRDLDLHRALGLGCRRSRGRRL